MELKYMDNIKDDKYYASKSIEHINLIQQYSNNLTYDEFMADQKVNDSIMFRFIQLIENIKNLSDEFKNKNPQIPWGDIIGFRNGIVHEYGHTDYRSVHKTFHGSDLDELKEVLGKIQ